MTKAAGLYVHIPFCDARCNYCDFVTFTDQSRRIDSYLDALAFELSTYCDQPLQTIFVGGGTPTVLSPAQIATLFATIQRTMDTGPLGEVTIEANPESATRERLDAFRHAGVNRISFGLQSANNSTLHNIGRLHDFETFLTAYHTARDAGFENINVDLMFGLPGQSAEDWRATLEAVLELQPDHISTYALKIEPATKMARDRVTVDGDMEAEMYLIASERLTRASYRHYEISNFCRPGREARHNLLYWENQNTIGVGISSASYFHGKRYTNTTKLAPYIDDCLKGRLPERTETLLSEADRDRETMMLKLRLKEGVDERALNALEIPMVSTFLKQGLATVEKGMYSLNPNGWLMSNALFQYFV